ncbi:MAG: hypothetical protein HND55_13510 [Pseudomonadota bacterium]|nr:MAG: hypothetical protein HND55_13510 [Pseudomonadota bacterium]
MAVVVTELTALLTALLIAVLDQARTFLMRLGGHGMAVHAPAESGEEHAQGQ